MAKPQHAPLCDLYGTHISSADSVYRLLVRMARAAGWLRMDGWWWHEGHSDDHPLGEVIEIILLEHGVDLREPVPGEKECVPDHCPRCGGEMMAGPGLSDVCDVCEAERHEREPVPGEERSHASGCELPANHEGDCETFQSNYAEHGGSDDLPT